MTFLELCQAYRAEIGIPGNGPVSVNGQIGELARVVLDIQDADQTIKELWQDWNFLWRQFASTTVAGAAWLTLQKPNDLGSWDTNSAWLDKTMNSAAKLEYVDYDDWKNDQAVGVQYASTPHSFTVMPDGQLRVFPQANVPQAFTADYWKSAARLENAADVSDIPEEFHRLIIVRAKLIYAEREDAPEIMAGASAEFDSTLTRLEAKYLPGQRDGTQARVKRPREMRVV